MVEEEWSSLNERRLDRAKRTGGKERCEEMGSNYWERREGVGYILMDHSQYDLQGRLRSMASMVKLKASPACCQRHRTQDTRKGMSRG